MIQPTPRSTRTGTLCRSTTLFRTTADAVTLPAGKYRIDDQIIYYFTERNAYRMPDYHRLDLGATWQLKQRKKISSELTFSLYNAYGRENAYTISFREGEDNPNITEAVQTAIFKFIDRKRTRLNSSH